ncbi:hypothetical protein KAK06_03195 [Ideonella sp. 4Y11]|uniref:Ketosynthase family 3 (KS3) domain-containing protein n=1 Tax=Ideonella aquatica TaxID=2824119 RepID=A0A941BEP9_9BURK|nr:beta-ketoacyl synthase N-terminal-like domain-containing protein [Ideonella aquatica]MBQ0957956.1 hypothetical protein [Ideonella aquatica]
MHPELVITAASAVGPFGDDPQSLWSSLTAGQPLPLPPCVDAGTLPDFDLRRFHDSRDGHRRPRTSQYAMAAAARAIGQARLDSDPQVDRDEVAIVYGTGTGPVSLTQRMLAALVDKGLTGVEPLWFQESVFNAPASWVGIEFGFRGPLVALPMGWAAGGHALATAADMLQFGHAEIALVLLSDELAPVAEQAYRALGMTTPNDGGDDATRPLDRRANGTRLGEGAAAVVLETAESARRRGVTPLARLTGWSVTSDEFGVGAKDAGTPALDDAMTAALAMAGRQQVDAVYSGAYGTLDAARAEAHAMQRVFGPQQPPLTNIRGVVGEARGATALWNIVAALSSLDTGLLPPAVGCEQPDPDWGLRIAGQDEPPDAIDTVLCNAYWVNGVNTSIVLETAR